jgi:hypothetical protein
LFDPCLSLVIFSYSFSFQRPASIRSLHLVSSLILQTIPSPPYLYSIILCFISCTEPLLPLLLTADTAVATAAAAQRRASHRFLLGKIRVLDDVCRVLSPELLSTHAPRIARALVPLVEADARGMCAALGLG